MEADAALPAPERGCRPQPGDLIEIFRPGGYQHWAVYVGDDDVVHLTVSSGKSGCLSCSPCVREKAEMQKHKLSRVIDSCRWRINNALDRKCSPRGGGAIVRAALAVVGSRPDYCVLQRNCEHVATELRYGEASSAQASRLTGPLLQYAGFLLHTFCLQGLDPQQVLTLWGPKTLQL